MNHMRETGATEVAPATIPTPSAPTDECRRAAEVLPDAASLAVSGYVLETRHLTKRFGRGRDIQTAVDNGCRKISFAN